MFSGMHNIRGNCNTLQFNKKYYRVILTKNIDYELNKDELLSCAKDGQKKVIICETRLTISRLII